MILLLEGANCTGKTTLARAFSEALSIPILKFNVPPENAYGHFRSVFLAQAEASPHFVIDRCHLSNQAYNGQLGGGVMSEREHVQIDLLLRQWGAWLFLMVDDPQSIAERLQARTGRDDGAEALVRPQIGDLQNRFLEAYDNSMLEPKATYSLPQFVNTDGSRTAQFDQMARLMGRLIHYPHG